METSAALAPWAVGFASGSTIFSCSMIEPGHPCVDDQRQRIPCLTHVNEMNVEPVDSVMKFGRAFSFVSHLRQS